MTAFPASRSDEIATSQFRGMVTVVVPAYNAEKHLRACLNSVLLQPEVGELILVDDGSTDRTLILADARAKLDRRVHVFSQTNSGVSAARNKGVIHASRPWLAFVDADDIVPEGAFATLCACAAKYDSDLCYGEYRILRTSGFELRSHELDKFPPGRISVRNILLSLVSLSPESLSGSSWRVLFRTSFVRDNSITFPIGIRMSEDYSFILQCLSNNPKVSYVDREVYIIRREGDSVTQRYQPHLAHDMETINMQLREICTGDEDCMVKYWANVANTAWYVCRNVYKPKAPQVRSERRLVVISTVVQYREALRRLRFKSGMAPYKVILLKLALLSPGAFWMLLEVCARII